MYGKTINVKKERQSVKGNTARAVILFFHLENRLDLFKKLVKSVRQLVCECLFKWSKFLLYGDRLSEKFNQVD